MLSSSVAALGVFQGDTSPLSCKEVIEMCVMPILLYSVESWIVKDGVLKNLESFQGGGRREGVEVAKAPF